MAGRDLTHGSVLGHLVTLAAPVLVFLLAQTLYFLVDLYFVAPLGEAVIAGVSMGGNVLLVNAALFEVLSVGTAALIAHAIGRKDHVDASVVFNQALMLSVACGVFVLIAGYLLTAGYVRSLTTDEATIEAGVDYLYWFIPALVLQFAMVVVGAALRAAGTLRATMTIFAVSVVLNIVLAPILIAGVGAIEPMGAAGAGLATSLSNLVATVLLWIYFKRNSQYVAINRRHLRPIFRHWRRILNVGLPAGGEMALLFTYTAVTYWVINDSGASAQAGFGLRSRLMQLLLIPVVAVSFAAVPVAGQNVGADLEERVRETFRRAVVLNIAMTLAATLFLQLWPRSLVVVFSEDQDVVAAAALFLQLGSLSLVARAVAYTCSSLFQALGNTSPALASSCISLVAFAAPAMYLSASPEFAIERVWYLWTAAVVLQAGVSALWLRFDMKRRYDSRELLIAGANQTHRSTRDRAFE